MFDFKHFFELISFSDFQKFGVQPHEVEETLEGGDYQSHLAIAYRLIVDNKHMEEKHAIEEFK
jgi:hypothetical protein